MRAQVFSEILEQLNRGETARLEISSSGESFVRAFVPEERLILLGGGHVSLALARMAAMLDFSVTVVDDRPEFANRERFDMASKVVCDSFENAVKGLGLRENNYVCVMTRGHRWDDLCVRAVLSAERLPSYIGLISSRRRAEGLKRTLIDSGFDVEAVDSIHAPIGLAIGAVTPAEIAVSVCAQMIAHRRSAAPVMSDDVMKQTNTDYSALRFLAESDEPRAMLLVLSSTGSTPVKSGAMMAVNALGKGFGTIGGGCSEAAAVNKARRVIGTGQSKITEFDMSAEVAAENGLVCGGVMRVLIEDITE